MPDLQRIALAVGLSALTIALVLLMLPPQEPPVPRSVLLLDPILLIMILEAISKLAVIPRPPRLRSGQAPAEESACYLIQKQIPRCARNDNF